MEINRKYKIELLLSVNLCGAEDGIKDQKLIDDFIKKSIVDNFLGGSSVVFDDADIDVQAFLEWMEVEKVDEYGDEVNKK